jgi:hypothetical protein
MDEWCYAPLKGRVIDCGDNACLSKPSHQPPPATCLDEAADDLNVRRVCNHMDTICSVATQQELSVWYMFAALLLTACYAPQRVWHTSTVMPAAVSGEF